MGGGPPPLWWFLHPIFFFLVFYLLSLFSSLFLCVPFYNSFYHHFLHNMNRYSLLFQLRPYPQACFAHHTNVHLDLFKQEKYTPNTLTYTKLKLTLGSSEARNCRDRRRRQKHREETPLCLSFVLISLQPVQKTHSYLQTPQNHYLLSSEAQLPPRTVVQST